jgi:hypothetical protein
MTYLTSLFLIVCTFFTAGAFAQNFGVKQNRYQLSYIREGHHQTLRFKGTLIVSSGENEETLLSLLKNRIEPGLDTLIVLDVFGGDLALVNKMYDLLKGKCHDRGHSSCEITTQVEMFRTCASACIPLYMVGDKRVAAERSEWGFHAAAIVGGYVKIPFMSAYVLKTKGVNPVWLEKNKKMFSSLAVTWLSPLKMNGSNIITQVITHPE